MNINELDSLRINMVDAKKLFDAAAIKYAAENCGHSIGDIIEVNSYAHQGKKMRITSFDLVFDNWKREYIAVANGVVLKNNGDDSKNTAYSNFKLGSIG